MLKAECLQKCYDLTEEKDYNSSIKCRVWHISEIYESERCCGMEKKIAKNKLSLNWYNEMARLRPADLVAEAERDYYSQVEEIADKISGNTARYRVVLLAGPSGSGKTTTASKLRKQLEQLGVDSVYISLDNFFIDRDQLPLLPDGMKDYESIRTLDMDCLNQFFESLLQTNRASIPIFDFQTGKRSEKTVDIETDENTVVIIEGIHALNPVITEGHYNDKFYRIYISPKSEFERDGKIVLNSRNTRLIRRMVRDYYFRGSSPINTMQMWKHVVEGEDLYIRPFRTTADYWIDSTHKYEPMIFHHYLLPILDGLAPGSDYDAVFLQLRETLGLFYDLGKELVPENSLLREFIGSY